MLFIFITLLCCYIALFLLSLRIRDNSIVDIFWGIGFIIIAIMGYLLGTNTAVWNSILTLLILAWGIRLSTHIARKKCSHSGEDARYRKWREEWKYFYTRSFFQVYLLQWVFMCIIALPIFMMNFYAQQETGLSFITLLWACIALAWLWYEIKADRELSSFMKVKKPEEILTSWMRKYSRYPQYFWESMFWFGICVIASQVSMIAFVWWAVITYLVRYVSWAAMLEARYEGNKKYEAYSKKTPIFIPNFFL